MKTFLVLSLLLLLGVRPLSASQVFADNFTRADTGTGGVGNGWQDSASLYRIGGNALKVGAVNTVPLLRDAAEGRSNFQAIIEVNPALVAPIPTNTQQWVYLKYIDGNNWIALKLARGATNYTSNLIVWKGGVQYASVLTLNTGTTRLSRAVVNLWQNASGVNVQYVLYQSNTLGGYTQSASSTIYTYSADAVFSGSFAYGLGLEQTTQQFKSIAYADTTQQTLPTDDAVFVSSLSPYNWHLGGANYAEAVNSGAYFHCLFTGTSLALTMDTSHYNMGWTQSSIVKCSVDGKPWTKLQWTAGKPQITLTTRELYGTHSVEFWVMNAPPAGGTGQDKWFVPNMFCSILSLQLDVGEALLPDARRPRTILFFADSIGGIPSKGATFQVNDAQENWSANFAEFANAEHGMVSIGSAGYLANGSYMAPPIFTPGNDAMSSWNKFFNGVSRLDNGLFNPAPDWIIVTEGVNDTGGTDAAMQASVQGLVEVLRGAAPNAYIFMAPPFSHWREGNISAGVANYQTANPADTKVFYVPLSMETARGLNRGVPSKETMGSNDGVHPDAWKQGALGHYMFFAIDRILNPISPGERLLRPMR